MARVTRDEAKVGKIPVPSSSTSLKVTKSEMNSDIFRPSPEPSFLSLKKVNMNLYE